MKKTQRTLLEDNPPIEDDPINVQDVKPLVVPEKVGENQAGGEQCIVDMEIMKLKPALKQQPTAR